MKVIDLLKESELYPRILECFPGMVETAKETEVIPWHDEFAIADKNPEIIDTIEYFRILLNGGVITKEEYAEKQKNIVTGYASKTIGIAFNNNKKVSFRQTPSIWTVLHELGHVHFQEVDAIWSATYGGGEQLMMLALRGTNSGSRIYATEAEIRLYHSLLHDANKRPAEVAKEIAEQIIKKTRNSVCCINI